jgi:translation elongation factor EF-Ts
MNCETDFVARNEDFQKAQSFLNAAFEMTSASVEELKEEVDGLTIEKHLEEMVGKIGEKIEISRVVFGKQTVHLSTTSTRATSWPFWLSLTEPSLTTPSAKMSPCRSQP